MREDGIAAQFTRMKARFERLDRLCIARAISSLPVPVSPKTKTVESVGATFETWISTWRNGSEEPTISSNMDERTMSSLNATFSFRVLSSARLRSSISVPVAYQRTRPPVRRGTGCNGGGASDTDRPSGALVARFQTAGREPSLLCAPRAPSRDLPDDTFWRESPRRLRLAW